MTSKEEQEALQEMETILNETRPKDMCHGFVRGASCIIEGGVGAVGTLVLTPIHTAQAGSKEGGILGGAVGALGGVLAGTVGAVSVAAGGVVKGVTTAVRGVANTPEAVMAPGQGKWWNENDGEWIVTNLEDEQRWSNLQPENDDDILGEVRSMFKTDDEDDGEGVPQVKDTYYYDALQVPTDVDESTVKRQYYILARRYSPDRSGQSEEATQKFKAIGEAYVILSNPEYRERYDKCGRDFMYMKEGEEVIENDLTVRIPMVDPIVLYGTLFGSEKFESYIGTLAAATSASVGDTPDITKTQARLLQKRRVTKLAFQLAERLKYYAEGNLPMAKADWKTEAEYLTKSSYGTELTHTIGKVYTISAIQWLGSRDSGVGMPSISAWAKRTYTNMKETTESGAFKVTHLAGDTDLMTVQAAISAAGYVDKSPEEQAALQKALALQVRKKFLRSMWTTTVVDITNTLHETVQMVLFDQAVDVETRTRRGEGLKLMGEIFAHQPHPDGPNVAMDGQLAYEEVAFAAMLETAVRKEQWSRKAEELYKE